MALGCGCVELQWDFGMPLADGWGVGGSHWCVASWGLISPSSWGKLISSFAGEGESASKPVPHHCTLIPLA